MTKHLTPEDLSSLTEPIQHLWRQDELHLIRDLSKYAASRLRQYADKDYDTDDDDFFGFLLYLLSSEKKTVKQSNQAILAAFLTEADVLDLDEKDPPYEHFKAIYEDVEHDTQVYAQTGTKQAAYDAESIAKDHSKDIDEKGLENVLKDVTEEIANIRPVQITDRRESITAAISRTVLTGLNAGHASTEIMRAVTSDGLIEVSAHFGARPTHMVWQGGIYHIGGDVAIGDTLYPDFETATGFGTGEGLCGWNCRHSFWHYDGTRSYTDAQLEEMRRAGSYIDGVFYSEYEIQQKIKYQERRMRDLENLYFAREGAGISDTQTLGKIKIAEKKIRNLSALLHG